MQRLVNFIFIILLLTIYSNCLKKLKTKDDQCKVVKSNVSDMSFLAKKGMFIIDEKLYAMESNQETQISCINAKRIVVITAEYSLAIDTDDNLRILTLRKDKNEYKISYEEKFKDKFANIFKFGVTGFAVRKGDGVIFKIENNELKEINIKLKNPLKICGNKRLFVYTDDNYLGYLNPNKNFQVEKLATAGKPIEINPNSQISCTETAVFYGIKNETELSYLDFISKATTKLTKFPIKDRVILVSDNVWELNNKKEWQECSLSSIK